MKIAIAQCNFTVGDINGNEAKIRSIWAEYAHVDLIVFSELSLSGYPPQDLLERRDFQDRINQAVNQLIEYSKQYPKTAVLIGAPMMQNHCRYNMAIMIEAGLVVAKQAKTLLPTYDVFDEKRYFTPATSHSLIPFRGMQLGVSICEDAWFTENPNRYDIDPMHTLGQLGATLLINLSGSPFSVGKDQIRYQLLSRYAKNFQVPVIYVNQVGGQDELVFDGDSMVINPQGGLVTRLPAFQSHVAVVDFSTQLTSTLFVPNHDIEMVYQALVLGIRDYVQKCGFSKIVLGLSGGIDSAVTAVLAADAIGANQVMGVLMPSMYSSIGSVQDAELLASALGIQSVRVPIEPIFNTFIHQLAPVMGTHLGVTEENLQARIRGVLLMAFSNQSGALLLTTGNKSELAMGYCTLYGDMNGGLAAISDLFKSTVYQLAEWINRTVVRIPVETITKSPSAELRPNQTDQDSLPPYDILDTILQGYLEKGLSVAELIEMGHDSAQVSWIVSAVNKNEYKRRQAAPGIKLSSKAFGLGRRFPIAAVYPKP